MLLVLLTIIVLFVALQPGLLVTLPPVGNKLFMSGKSNFTALLMHALLFTLAVGYVLPNLEGFREKKVPMKPTKPNKKPKKEEPDDFLTCKNNEFITAAVYDTTKTICNPCPDGYTCDGIDKKPCKTGYSCTGGKSKKVPQNMYTGDIPGARSSQDTTSDAATSTAMQVLAEFDKTNPSPFVSGLLRVTKYSSQVVAGMNYYVEFEWGPSKCLKSNTPTSSIFGVRSPTQCPPISKAGTITGRVYSGFGIGGNQITVTSS